LGIIAMTVFLRAGAGLAAASVAAGRPAIELTSHTFVPATISAPARTVAHRMAT
jgi:hypothetical protein